MLMGKKKIVIIGGVAGGASSAARLRRLSEEDSIIMFEKDEYISFANCGLPYYIGNIIKDRENLIVQTVEGMSKRFNIDIRNMQEVIKINKEEKTVEVFNHKDKNTYVVNYDKLIISTGSEPIVPSIQGIEEASNILTLRNIPDTDKIKAKTVGIKKAVVIGGGFIGIEMAENLAQLGIKVTLVEKQNQIMSPFDYEMSCMIHKEMIDKGVSLKLGVGVAKFEESGKYVVLENGEKLCSDLTILSIGIRPNTKIAKEAGLEIGTAGGLVVDENLLTSDKDIYACGDVIETTNIISNKKQLLALAWPANRQARLIADNINNIEAKFEGVIGSSVAKVFNLTVATTGLNEKMAKSLNIKYETIYVHRDNHAAYYPNATNISIKLVFEKETGLVLGAQAIGQEGTEKRIDVIATAIMGKMNVYDLTELELCYAPPFSSAKDPVNIAGYTATNVLEKAYKTVRHNEVDDLIAKGAVFIDVRSAIEFEHGNIKGSKNIDIDSLRSKLEDLPKDKDTPIYMYCQVGFRGYLGTQILKHNGYKNVYNLSGGYKLYEVVYKS
jgi:NADPH-dependent 2,4-dienoyl-CoA reductase/sulfur reductase-like enzyme/rhodanese-related sulfurtransferase